ncbi:hypothetical protein [Robertmurraya andreesenii]|uniref:Lipoprotein n=1 Tax=Anoxybacillus andreesenii TaxID=1325932 RepID=A0ABT9V9T3_9BACL|nr:hypothetical protein [Robertmurraya andreesenii]MDQ0157683.1 hypothetical protein [Robertmurraya andreesenii]
MKRYLFLLFLVAVFSLYGCGQDDSVVKEKEGLTIKDEERKDPDQEEKEEQGEQVSDEMDRSHFKSAYFDLELMLDKEAMAALKIDESKSQVCFSLEDNTLLMQSLEIGCVDYLAQPVEEFREEALGGMHMLVKADSTGENTLAFRGLGENPYVTYKENEELLPEEELLIKSYHLLERSVIQTGFFNLNLYSNQELPKNLDSNEMVGIEISENMLKDLTSWYSSLKTAMDDGVDNNEWRRLIEKTSKQSNVEYPEIHQIPFPTVEIGANIANLIFEFQSLMMPEHYGDEYARIASENMILEIGNGLKVIEKQLDEIKNTYGDGA